MKTRSWVPPFCARQFVPVTSWTRPADVAKIYITSWTRPADVTEIYITSWTRPADVAEIYITSWTSLFCSLLVKSNPTWLHPEGLNFLEAKKYFRCINIDTTTTLRLQLEIFAHFLHLRAVYIFAWDSLERTTRKVCNGDICIICFKQNFL